VLECLVEGDVADAGERGEDVPGHAGVLPDEGGGDEAGGDEP
jgi:hypothetical protein